MAPGRVAIGVPEVQPVDEYDRQGRATFGDAWDTIKDADARLKEQGSIVDELMAADPKLPLWTALTMAGDRQSKRAGTAAFDNGKGWFDAAQFVGSYARLEWVVEMLEQDRIDPLEVYPHLCDLWRGSDPDDSDPRFLTLWRAARKERGVYLRDGKALPMRGQITIHRGQDTYGDPPGTPSGIAWSLNFDVAIKFANGAATRQADRGGVVITRRVRRVNVLGYMVVRGEDEVIVDPETLLP